MATEKLLGGNAERLVCWGLGDGESFGRAGGGAGGLGAGGNGGVCGAWTLADFREQSKLHRMER